MPTGSHAWQGTFVKAKPGKSRVGCGCFTNRDIGNYDTCVLGCRHCYATANEALAKRFHGLDDLRTEMLIPLVQGSVTERIQA